jgi:hypothetical protein
LVGWLVGWLAGWLVGRLVGWKEEKKKGRVDELKKVEMACKNQK